MAFLKNLWPPNWFQNKQKVVEPTISVKFNNEYQIVKIIVDWPDDYPDHVLKNQFCSMLLALQTGVYHKTIMEALINKGNVIGCQQLINDIILSIHEMSSKSVLESNNDDPVSMWPAETFKGGGSNNE